MWEFQRVGKGFRAKKRVDYRKYTYIIPCSIFSSKSNEIEFEDSKINLILDKFVGNHKFHNFTSSIGREVDQSSRFIKSFKVCKIIFLKIYDSVLKYLKWKEPNGFEFALLDKVFCLIKSGR